MTAQPSWTPWGQTPFPRPPQTAAFFPTAGSSTAPRGGAGGGSDVACGRISQSRGWAVRRCPPRSPAIEPVAVHIATHILAFEGESKVSFFDGNLSEYEEWRRQQLGDAATRPDRITYRKLTR